MSKKHKTDNSPSVPQREKIKENLRIREFKWTPKQEELIKLIEDNNSKLVFIKAPAGCGKSLISFYCGLKMLNNKRVSEILYSRPILESADSNSKLGYLPGTRDDKIEKYAQICDEKLEELISGSEISKLFNDKRVNFLEVNYVRGLSIRAKFWIIDESQGFCTKELITLMTRISHASKVIICADPSQSDLPPNKQGGFEHLFKLFSDDESKQNGIFTYEFTKDDIMRSPLCKFIVEKIETLKPQ